jgi:molybdate transport system substrate-binding protein
MIATRRSVTSVLYREGQARALAVSRAVRYAPGVRHLACLVAVLASLGACSPKKHEKTFRVAAAADLSRAFDELGKAFAKKTGITPLFQWGSSGLLAKQIEQGAPYALFAAANHGYAQEVVQAGKCDRASMQSCARGRLVVWSPSGVTPPQHLADLIDPRYKRISIANPAHAPYGRAAQQALEKANIWDKLQDRIVLGDSVRAAMQYAQTRSVDAAVVALSLAVVTDGGTSIPVDPASYDPLDQQLVVCGTGPQADEARQFVQFISSPDGREVMTRYGFLLPNEHLPQAAKAP